MNVVHEGTAMKMDLDSLCMCLVYVKVYLQVHTTRKHADAYGSGFSLAQ